MGAQGRTEGINLRTEQGVLWLTLQGPHGNRLSADDLGGLRRAIRRVEPGVGTVVLTGRDGAFCEGLSLPDGPRSPDVTGRWLRETVVPTLVALYELGLPTIAAIDGAAAGVGAALSLACDLRFGSPRARLDPEGIDGLAVAPGLSWLSAARAGYWGGARLAFLGPLDSDEALRLGMLTVVSAELDEVVRSTAERLAASPSAGMKKRALLRARELGFEDALDYESRLTEVAVEAVAGR